MINVIDINSIQGAKYNPRKITKDQQDELKKSLDKFGIIVPILVNRTNNTIIAGHQRTTAAKMIGIKEVPVQYVDGIQIGDEIKFNQIHNAVDVENATVFYKKDCEKSKFIELSAKDFEIGECNASVVKEICKLTLKYSNVLSAVICKGKVILGGDYVKACELLNIPVNAYVCEDNLYEDLVYYFNQDYGKYCYEKISRNTYVQGLAQLHRSVVKEEGKKAWASGLYTQMVLPYLQKHEDINSILDFGCGKGAYINSLKKHYKALGLEFFNNNGKQINISMGNKMIDDLIKHIRLDKNFDIVVCDSVLNSVDSIEAERSVLDCLNLFAKDVVFISGRTVDEVLKRKYGKKDRYIQKRLLEFLDDDYFTANFREGKWYFQHYHDKEMLIRILNESGFKIKELKWDANAWRVMAIKEKELSKERYMSAINFEFDLPLPNGKSYKRNKDVLEVLGFDEN